MYTCVDTLSRFKTSRDERRTQQNVRQYRRHVRQRSDAHGSAQIVRENEKCGAAAPEQPVVVNAVGDAAHAVFSDTEPNVSTGWVGGAKVTARSDIVESASVEVCAAADAVGKRG